ncbi:Fe(3+)-dicitrate ABC transporter substrate-binding protein FecB, partial [Vibrio alginolyticus]
MATLPILGTGKHLALEKSKMKNKKQFTIKHFSTVLLMLLSSVFMSFSASAQVR